jgi:hypothetical protein
LNFFGIILDFGFFLWVPAQVSRHNMSSSGLDQSVLMKEVLGTLRVLQASQVHLAANVDAITGRVNILAGIKEVQDAASAGEERNPELTSLPRSGNHDSHDHVDTQEMQIPESPSINPTDPNHDGRSAPLSLSYSKKPSGTSRIILT